MKEFLDNSLDKLRKKDDPQKAVISFIAAAIITFVIVSSWLTWTLVKDEEVKTPVEEKPSEDVTPISNIGSQASEIKEMFSELIGQFKSTQEVLEAIPQVEVQENTVNSTTSATTTNSTTTMEIESSVE
jgi:hypothetical protein